MQPMLQIHQSGLCGCVRQEALHERIFKAAFWRFLDEVMGNKTSDKCEFKRH